MLLMAAGQIAPRTGPRRATAGLAMAIVSGAVAVLIAVLTALSRQDAGAHTSPGASEIPASVPLTYGTLTSPE